MVSLFLKGHKRVHIITLPIDYQLILPNFSIIHDKSVVTMSVYGVVYTNRNIDYSGRKTYDLGLFRIVVDF